MNVYFKGLYNTKEIKQINKKSFVKYKNPVWVYNNTPKNRIPNNKQNKILFELGSNIKPVREKNDKNT